MSKEIEKIISSVMKSANDTYNSINDYVIQLGVIAGKANRKKTFNIDINNAELLFIHENGSPIRNIPKRPILDITLQSVVKDELPKTLDRIFEGVYQKNWSKDDVKTELEKLCIRIQNKARRIIQEGKELAPLKYRDGTPLYDTGQLMRSITCRLVLTSSINNNS